VTKLADTFAVDLDRVITVGHSAGGQLALWLAARHRLPASSPLYSEEPIIVAGVLGLAAAADLAMLQMDGSCDNVVDRLMGGPAEQFPSRYRQASPAEMVPLGVRQVLIMGVHDTWTRVANSYYEAAKASGDIVQRIDAPESSHFEMIVPSTSTWPIVRDAALDLLKSIR
jgi:acetyl esterase/lipase